MSNEKIIKDFKKYIEKFHCEVCCDLSDYRESGIHTCAGTAIVKALEQALSRQKEEINKKWEKKTIIIPKGKTHPVHDKCENCYELAKEEFKKVVDTLSLILPLAEKYVVKNETGNNKKHIEKHIKIAKRILKEFKKI